MTSMVAIQSRSHGHLQIRLPATSSTERGFIHQISDPEGLDAARGEGADHRLYRLSTRRRPASISAIADPVMMLLLDAGDRPQADQPDGRRHLDGRRSLLQRRARKLLTVEEIERNIDGIKQGLRATILDFGGPASDHGQQCRLAAGAQLCRVPARCRPAFLGQPHAVLRQRQDCGSTASSRCPSSNSTT